MMDSVSRYSSCVSGSLPTFRKTFDYMGSEARHECDINFSKLVVHQVNYGEFTFMGQKSFLPLLPPLPEMEP